MAKKKYHNMPPKERLAYWEEEREKERIRNSKNR